MARRDVPSPTSSYVPYAMAENLVPSAAQSDRFERLLHAAVEQNDLALMPVAPAPTIKIGPAYSVELRVGSLPSNVYRITADP